MNLFGVYAAGCLLLCAAGAAKALRPADTANALGRALPRAIRTTGSRHLVVRVLAGAECALGAAGLLTPVSAVAATVAASYALFAVVVAMVRGRSGMLATCGCLGRADTPAGTLHIVMDVGLAAVSVVIATSLHRSTLAAVLRGQPLGGAPLLADALLATFLIGLALGPLTRLAAVRMRLE